MMGTRISSKTPSNFLIPEIVFNVVLNHDDPELSLPIYGIPNANSKTVLIYLTIYPVNNPYFEKL